MGDAKLRILVADDEEGVLFALKEYLGCCGWDVDAVLPAGDQPLFVAPEPPQDDIRLTAKEWSILSLVNGGLLVVGCFMESTAILLIATPTLYPLIVALGIDPVHFGIILVVNLLIGTLTPPFGVILFIMMDIAKVSLARMSRAVLPFYVPLAATLVVVTYWADFVLAVPRFFGKPG